LRLLVVLDARHLRFGQEDHIPVIRHDAVQELAAVDWLKVLGGRHEDAGGWVHPAHFPLTLGHQHVRHFDHNLVRQAQAPGFHRGAPHDHGLARSNYMGEQGVTLQAAPDSVFLVRAKRSIRVHTGHREVTAVRFPIDNGVVAVVVIAG